MASGTVTGSGSDAGSGSGSDPGSGRTHRRRGAELEAALLAAAWQELVEVGYARLTMGSIARRAGTSEAVLYRRWDDKHQLVLAAIEAHRRSFRLEAPDTGSLRGDLIGELSDASRVLAGFYAIALAAAHSGLAHDTGLTFAQARDRIMRGQLPPLQRQLFRRSQERGEIDLARIPDAVLAVPFDLVRHDLLITLEPVPPERIEAIVDDVFLPLLAAYRPHRTVAGSESDIN